MSQGKVKIRIHSMLSRHRRLEAWLECMHKNLKEVAKECNKDRKKGRKRDRKKDQKKD